MDFGATVVAYIFVAFISTYSFHRYYSRKLGLKKIKSYLDSREDFFKTTYLNKLKNLQDATIHFDVDLKKYRQFSRMVNQELSQIQKKIFLFEEIDKRLNERIHDYTDQKETMDHAVKEIKREVEGFKRNKHFFDTLRNDIRTFSNRVENMDKRLSQIEVSAEKKAVEKFQKYEQHVNVELKQFHGTLDSKLVDYDRDIREQIERGGKTYQNFLTEWTHTREKSERIFQEEREKLFEQFQRQADQFYEEEKGAVSDLVVKLQRDTENLTQSVHEKIAGLEESMQTIDEKSLHLESEIEENRRVLLNRSADISGEILRNLKDHVQTYQKELVAELSQKQGELDKQMQGMKKILEKTESDVVEQVNQQFETIQTSIQAFEAQLTKQTTQIASDHETLKKDYLEKAQQELIALKKNQESFRKQQEATSKEGLEQREKFTACADFIQRSQSEIQGQKAEIHRLASQSQSELEKELGEFREDIARKEKEHKNFLQAHREKVVRALNENIEKNFNIELSHVRKEINRLRAKKESRIREFYDHLEKLKQKQADGFEVKFKQVERKIDLFFEKNVESLSHHFNDQLSDSTLQLKIDFQRAYSEELDKFRKDIQTSYLEQDGRSQQFLEGQRQIFLRQTGDFQKDISDLWESLKQLKASSLPENISKEVREKLANEISQIRENLRLLAFKQEQMERLEEKEKSPSRGVDRPSSELNAPPRGWVSLESQFDERQDAPTDIGASWWQKAFRFSGKHSPFSDSIPGPGTEVNFDRLSVDVRERMKKMDLKFGNLLEKGKKQIGLVEESCDKWVEKKEVELGKKMETMLTDASRSLESFLAKGETQWGKKVDQFDRETSFSLRNLEKIAARWENIEREHSRNIQQLTQEEVKKMKDAVRYLTGITEKKLKEWETREKTEMNGSKATPVSGAEGVRLEAAPYERIESMVQEAARSMEAFKKESEKKLKEVIKKEKENFTDRIRKITERADRTVGVFKKKSEKRLEKYLQEQEKDFNTSKEEQFALIVKQWEKKGEETSQYIEVSTRQESQRIKKELEKLYTETRRQLFQFKSELEHVETQRRREFEALTEKHCHFVEHQEKTMQTKTKEMERRMSRSLEISKLTSEEKLKKHLQEIEKQVSFSGEHLGNFKENTLAAFSKEIEILRSQVGKQMKELQNQFSRFGEKKEKDYLLFQKDLKKEITSRFGKLDGTQEKLEKNMTELKRRNSRKISALIEELKQGCQDHLNAVHSEVSELKRTRVQYHQGLNKLDERFKQSGKKIDETIDESRQVIYEMKETAGTLNIDYQKRLEQNFQRGEHKLDRFMEARCMDVDSHLREVGQKVVDTEKRFNEKVEKNARQVNKQFKVISDQLDQYTQRTKLFEKVDQLAEKLDRDLTLYTEKIQTLKQEQESMVQVDKKISQMRSIEKQTLELLETIRSEKGNIQKTAVQVKDLLATTSEIDKKVEEIEKNKAAIEQFHQDVATHAEFVGGLARGVNALTSRKEEMEEALDVLKDFQKRYKNMSESYESLDKKIDTSSEQQLEINRRLDEIEEKSILIEANHKKIIDFSKRYDDLEIALVDVEQRQKAIEKLKKELAVEKDQLLILKNELEEKIKTAVVTRDNRSSGKDKERSQENAELALDHDQVKEMVITLYKMGWPKEQIAEHLKKPLYEIDVYLKK